MAIVNCTSGHVKHVLPAALPRVGELGLLNADPLEFFRRARDAHGDAVVLRDDNPVFSRAQPCAGSLMLFGAANVRLILSNIDTFALPRSAARDLGLPRRLVNLNFGLHSRTGPQHMRHLVALRGILNDRTGTEQAPFIAQGLAAFEANAKLDRPFALFAAMRALTLQIASRMLLGDNTPAAVRVGAQLLAYFDARRSAASPFRAATPADIKALTLLGLEADKALRAQIRAARKAATSTSLLGRLAKLPGLNRDEIVGHLNVLFISSCAPVAIALTWIFLVLSQLPELRAALRHEIAGQIGTLVDSTVKECLRLLPPNALMLRLTRRPISLGEITVPKSCEVVLCPFLEHRNPTVFPEPDRFKPERWKAALPPPFTYFPFGAGGHYCIGSALALTIIKATLGYLLPRYDFVLAQDQEIDWRIDVQFFPRDDPVMAGSAPSAGCHQRGGRILGAVQQLFFSYP